MAYFSQLYSLISSLPALKMTEDPSISSQEFLDNASTFMTDGELAVLSAVSLLPQEDKIFPENSFSGKYQAWEKALRHSILRLRTAKRKDLSSVSSVNRETVFDCDADAAAVRAYSAADPLERERLLDAARWEKASELTLLHQFDLDVLCAYYLQLQLAEKWARRAAGNAAVNLDKAADLSKKSQTITKD